jgi:mRNA-degrading endonuclease RelE of RelBE toxin-antitoxin system
MSYRRHYQLRFEKDLAIYRSLRDRIHKKVEQISEDPYVGTERLGHPSGAINLKGCRSAHVGQNFRIIFVICKECRKEPECEYCFCEGLPDETVVFLTVGPHAKAYAMK